MIVILKYLKVTLKHLKRSDMEERWGGILSVTWVHSPTRKGDQLQGNQCHVNTRQYFPRPLILHYGNYSVMCCRKHWNSVIGNAEGEAGLKPIHPALRTVITDFRIWQESDPERLYNPRHHLSEKVVFSFFHWIKERVMTQQRKEGTAWINLKYSVLLLSFYRHGYCLKMFNAFEDEFSYPVLFHVPIIFHYLKKSFQINQWGRIANTADIYISV